MANVTITITNEDEITYITDVAEANQLTVQQYITNIVRGWIQNRVRNIYIGHVNTMTLPELKALLGPYQDIE